MSFETQWPALVAIIVAGISAWSGLRTTRVQTKSSLEEKAVDALVASSEIAALLAAKVPRLEALIDVLVHELWQHRSAMMGAGLDPGPLSPLLREHLPEANVVKLNADETL